MRKSISVAVMALACLGACSSAGDEGVPPTSQTNSTKEIEQNARQVLMDAICTALGAGSTPDQLLDDGIEESDVVDAVQTQCPEHSDLLP